MVFKPQQFTGSAADYHAEIVRRTMLNARQVETPRDAVLGPFLITSLHRMVPQGHLYLRVYTARYADVGQTFLFSANTLDATAKFLPTADSMIARITVPAIATPAAAAAPQPVSAPPATKPGQLDGVYL